MAKLLTAKEFGAHHSIPARDLTTNLANDRAFSRVAQAMTIIVLTWRQRRRDRTMLARLDAHMLRDIGVSVQDATVEIEKPFWRA